MSETLNSTGWEGKGMNAKIYFVTQEDGSSSGFLVDEHLVFTAIEDGKTKLHCPSALSLRELKAGELGITEFIEENRTEIYFPQPVVLSLIHNAKMKKADIQARNIHPKAAEVMLKLAAAANNVQVAFDGSGDWQFGDIVERSRKSEVTAVNSSKMLAAWLWSAWDFKKSNGTQRHAEMKALGYDGTPKALRDMLSDLGLVATKKS
jgi:hypothetical protein